MYIKITLPILMKKGSKAKKREGNTWIWWMLGKKFIPPNSGCYTREHTYEHSQTRCVYPIIVPPSTSIERVGEYASEIVISRATRVCERSSFWGSVLATARSTNADPVLRRWRHSWDCTAYICLHRLRTTTSNIHTRCLVWMELPMPWASIPPRGTLCP
jgi:hypothetical protein